MSQCKTVYLDEDGNKAISYYDNGHLGHEKAYAIYLKYMNSKFSKVKKDNRKFTSFDAIHQLPFNDKTKGVRKMIVEAQENIMSDKIIDEKAELLLLRMKAKEFITKTPLKYNYTITEANTLLVDKTSIKINPAAMDDAKDFYNLKPELFLLSKNTIKENWSFQTETGIDVDRYITEFLEDYNKAKKVSKDVIIKDIIDNLDLSDISTDDSKDQMKETVLKLFSAVQKFTDQQGIYNYELIPQFKLSNDDLKMQGRMDLVIRDMDSSRIVILDYKFKEKGREFMFNSTMLDKMPGVFSGLFNNKKTQAELQLSGYTLLIEKAGYNASNIEAYIIPIVGKPVKSKNKIVSYENIEVSSFVKMDYRRSLIGKFLKSRYKIDIDNNVPNEVGKHNTTKDIMLDLSNGEIEVPTYSIELDIEYILKNQVHTDEYTGKEYFSNKFTEKSEPFESDDIQDRKIQLRKYLVSHYADKDKLANNFVSYFYEGVWPGNKKSKHNKARAVQAKNLLSGLDPKDYTLQQMKNIYGFSDVDPNILVATNNKTKSAKLISVSVERDTFVKFENSRNVFGKFLDDASIQSKYKVEGLNNNKSSFRLLELGILALKLKTKNYIDSVESLATGTINGNNYKTDPPVVAYISDIIPQIKILGDLTKDNLSTSLKEILLDNKLLDSNLYKLNHLDEFMNILMSSSSYEALDIDSFKSEIKTSYDAYRFQQTTRRDFLNKLGEAQKMMYISLQPTLVVQDPSLLANNKEYNLLASAILDVAEFTLDPGALVRKKKSLDKITPYGSYDSPIIQQVYMLDHSTQDEVTRRFKDFAHNHEKFIKDLREDYKKRNPITSVNMLDVDHYKIFEDLYLENPNTEIQDYNNAFRLKDPNDKKNKLTKAQINYINFFNDAIKKGFGETLSSTQMEDFNVLWKEGTVPLVKASSENKIARAVLFKDKMKIWQNSLKYSGVKRSKKVVDDLFYTVNSEFDMQLSTDSSSQGSKIRREMLMIDTDGKLVDSKVSNLNKIETNLEHILHLFLADNLMNSAYHSTFAIYNSLQVKLLLEQETNFKPTADLRKSIDTYTKLCIFGEYKDDGKTGEVLDNIKNIGTKAIMAISAKQFIMEGGQNNLQYNSIRLSTLMAGLMGDKDAFIKNIKSHQEANEYSLLNKARKDNKSKIALAVEREFNLFNGDLTAMKSKEMQDTKNGSLFQSKWLLFLNSLPYKYYLTHTFFTKLVDDGVMSAYSESDGKAIYDASKDKRFNEIFENGVLKTNGLSDTGKDQLAYYNSLKRDLANEYDGINKNGIINRPYSGKEVTVIKEYLMKYYGSMDRNSKIEAHEGAWWRAVMTYKNWFPVKIANYWSPGALKESKGKRVKIMDDSMPEGFRYEFQAQWDEGIAQSLYFAYGQVIEAIKKDGYASFYKGLDSNKYSMHQRANMRRLLSDLLILLAMTMLLTTLLNSDMFNSTEGKYLISIANQSLADLNIFSSSDSIVSGSPFATYGFVKRSMENVWNVMHFSVTGDFDKAAESGSKLTGATNFLYKIS